jgi:glycosyltransferase involved in cell wall biosynthesis
MPRETLRLLIITPHSPLRHGGVERHVLEVSTRLAARGVTVTVLFADPSATQTEAWHDGVLMRPVRAWPRRGEWGFAPGLWREMAREEWDLVHVQSYHTLVAPLGMLRAAALHLPYVVTFHGGGHSSVLRNRVRPLQLRALRPLLARAVWLVAVARFEIDLYGRALRLSPERFVLIPNGVDVMPEPAQATPAGANGAVLASIGRLERYKGHHRVIEALPRVLEARPEATLLIVGTGPYEADLRRCAAELGVAQRVRFTSTPAGEREAMARLLSEVSLVVLMSQFESHPLVGIEAAAAGRRLLVADRGGLSELAERGLARAIAYEIPPAALGDAIIEELSKPLPAVVPQLETWDDCAEALLDLYRRVLARGADR